MTAGSEHPRDPHAGERRGPPAGVRGIPQGLLVACGPFAAGLPATRVAGAIASGLRAGGRGELDLCPLELRPGARAGLHELLRELDFDARMRRARALIVAERDPAERSPGRDRLIASITFELATRARQGGVPAYAITRAGALEPFDARMLDLQVVIAAGSVRTLTAAGRTLAALV